MSLRKDFVMAVMAKEATVAELCRKYGVSRKTAYKWIARFRERGVRGLVDESRRPQSAPTKTTAAMVAEVVALREAHSSWGPKKLRQLLIRTHADGAPSEKTIERVLREQGLTRKRRYRGQSIAAPRHIPEVTVGAPNDLWTVDFKGWWRTRDGARCEPLTVRDAYSRFVLGLRVMNRTGEPHVRPEFEALFRRYGLPKAIQSDNGAPFASVLALGGLTRLSAWWVALGIHVVRSRPGCPQDNGGHERMHVDVYNDLQTSSAPTLALQQVLCDEWATEFNHVRPHEALSMLTPSEVYAKSERRLAGLVVPSYPRHWHSVRVGERGKIEHRRRRVYVSITLAGHVVGLEDKGVAGVHVWFYDLLLGVFVAERDSKVSPPSPDGVTLCNPALGGPHRGVGTEDFISSEEGDLSIW